MQDSTTSALSSVDADHRGRTARRAQAAKNLSALEAVQNDVAFWEFVFHISHPRSAMAAVSCYALTIVFGIRMNAPLEVPLDFDPETLQRCREDAARLPECTQDTTAGQHFSRRFTVADVVELKARIRANHLGKARGADKKSYRDLLEIPNEVLCELFNACLEVRRPVYAAIGHR